MNVSMLVLLLVAADDPTAAADSPQKVDPIRTFYAETAARYEFYRDAEKKQKLSLVTTPVFKWSSDDDWSGDVFVWTYASRPELIGCILSGPRQDGSREGYQEFHLLSEHPIAPADMLGKFRWAPVEGLAIQAIDKAPAPAESAQLRLTQMRQLLRDFTASMEANGEWELRPLPQPLLRYQPTEGEVVDGALFAYIWPKGTDPEFLLMLECRKTTKGLAWYYVPARFSVRELWLKHEGKEVWRAPNLAGKNNASPDKPYISASFGVIPKSRLDQIATDAEKAK
jgi:hypothetical protein